MEKFLINGGKKLCGEIRIGGSKNAAVAVIPATILLTGKVTITNLPRISDTDVLCQLLNEMGSEISIDGTTMTINNENVLHYTHNFNLAGKMRASYYMCGALLGKYKEAEIPLPGGCNLGTRQIDQHIKGFEKLGAKVKISHGLIRIKADKLVGANICFDIISVGATINVMLAAVMAEGITKLENVAKEPHVVDIANLLNKAGAKIEGAGTDSITIYGVEYLKAVDHDIIPDQIETGTYMIAAAATMGNVLLSNVCPEHMELVIDKLIDAGAEVSVESKNQIRVKATKKLLAISIKTLPYPGFPTDLQSPMGTMLTVANGTSMIIENIWENRFKYLDELNKMGSNVSVDGRIAIIRGVDKITGARVTAPDLRGGAALIIAGLIAEGYTIVSGVEHVDRGYEDMETKLKLLGADIKRIKEEE